MTEPPLFIKIDELSQRLGLPMKWIKDMAKHSYIPSIRNYQGHLRFHYPSVKQALMEHQYLQAAKPNKEHRPIRQSEISPNPKTGESRAGGVEEVCS